MTLTGLILVTVFFYPSLGGVPSQRFVSGEAALRSIFSEALDPLLYFKEREKKELEDSMQKNNSFLMIKTPC